MALFELSKLSLYTLLLLSLLIQTTAKRSEMLPLPNNTTTTPASNDIQPTLTNDNNTSAPTRNDTNPSITNDAIKDAKPLNDYNTRTSPKNSTKNDNESPLTNDNSNDTAATKETNDNGSSLINDNDTLKASDTNDNNTSTPTNGTENDDDSLLANDNPNDSPATNPNDTEPNTANDDNNDSTSTDDNNDQETTSNLSPPQSSADMSFEPPAPASSQYASDDALLGYEYPPVMSPAAVDYDDDDDYSSEVTSRAARPTLVPAKYEAEDEVSAELAVEIEAYSAEEDRRRNDSGTVVVVSGFVCLVVLGGFLYNKKRKHDLMKSHYQYLNKRDDN